MHICHPDHSDLYTRLSIKEGNYLFPLYLYDQTPISASLSDAPDR